MRTELLDYELPEELIATHPPEARDGGRLLVLPRDSEAPLVHDMINRLDLHIPAGSLIVTNVSRVIPARLEGKKPTGGRVELLLVRSEHPEARVWKALGKASKGLSAGTSVNIGPGFTIAITGRDEDGLLVIELHTENPWKAIETFGKVPLPPYIRRAAESADTERYQTIFAKQPGSVAAPTAGLHLTHALIERLRAKNCALAEVVLHVGPGTFAPVTVDDLDNHRMHMEWYDVPEATVAAIELARREHRPIIAIGTTSVRALESWGSSTDAMRQGFTRLLIQPGYAFRVVDGLLTNFHLPRSTLLALVMALGGSERVRSAYASAVAERYRFFSYGDAMLLGAPTHTKTSESVR